MSTAPRKGLSVAKRRETQIIEDLEQIRGTYVGCG